MCLPRLESEVLDGLFGPPAVGGVTSASSYFASPGHPQVVRRNTLGVQHFKDGEVRIVQSEYSILIGPRLGGPCVPLSLKFLIHPGVLHPLGETEKKFRRLVRQRLQPPLYSIDRSVPCLRS